MYKKKAIDRLHPEAIKKSPIEYDMQFVEEGFKTNISIKFEEKKYEKLVKARCNDYLPCYIEELQYYTTHLEAEGIAFEIPSYDNASPENKIKIIVEGVLKMIKSLVNFINTPSTKLKRSYLLASYKFHNAIHSRIDMIEFVKTNFTYTNFSEIKETAEILKSKMISNINATEWLYGEETGNFIREHIKERIASIEIFHDFDEIDKNITALQKLNRDLNDAYFLTKSIPTGIYSLDVLLRLNYAFIKFYDGNSRETQNFINRILQNFEWNAFFNSELKTVTMLAPLMHGEVYTTDIFEEPFFTYWVLGHELYHSLFSSSTPIVLSIFENRTKCITNHYAQTCSKFAIGACGSGQSTLTEDGPDLESFRVLYSLLRERYSSEQLNAKIDGLDTTKEQAFFYYVAGGWCAKDEPRSEEEAKENPHSARNIRVNAAVSLMPEFAKAFKCKKGDAMFTDEDKCHVFGPKA